MISLIAFAGPAAAQPSGVDAETRDLIEAATATPESATNIDTLWRVSVGRTGSIEPVLDFLTRHLKATPSDTPSMRLFASLARRMGDLQRASKALADIPAPERTPTDDLLAAEVLDAQFKGPEAERAYEKLLERDLPAALRQQITLRLALMEGASAKFGTRLSKVAAEWEGPLRNQAAMILALSGRPKEALDLFQVGGEGTERFRQEVRMAEWALEAQDWNRAQELSHRAAVSAVMGRDRRYALTLLVEAHRQAKDLVGLLDWFTRAPELDEDSRRVWIDVLRETGRVDEALRLFRSSRDASRFDNTMRRELLELCREAGRDEVVVHAYRELMDQEPKALEWPEGLSRHYLERGDRPRAIAAWENVLTGEPTLRVRLSVAEALHRLGLDARAEEVARSCIGTHDAAAHAARLFLFDLHAQRGDTVAASAELEALASSSPKDSPVRSEIAAAHERLGNKQRAAETLEALREARQGQGGEDGDMKLAFLYSELNEEGKAEAIWLDLWKRIESIPRRRFVEERLMTVAARRGTLARLAVGLEQRLAAKEATEREALLLVQIYRRVNDAVSATEIIEEYLRSQGRGDLEVLIEQARLFLACNDHYNYDRTVRRLIDRDPEGRPDYLRELAMSLLERGQRLEARGVLEQLKALDTSEGNLEFEAGVLDLAGLHEDALRTYSRSLAQAPDRIDTYLLLAQSLVAVGQSHLASGMLQHLAMTASEDDLFTIAIDGILNLMGPRRRSGAHPLLAWAKRVTMERLARRPDKLYLFQLVADLADEHGDAATAARALKAALPIAGEQRSALMRDLMGRSQPGGARSALVVVQRGPPQTPSTEHLMMGRRLLGQGEILPPGVYLDLGTAFLAAKDVAGATRTFNAAGRLPEFSELQRQIGAAFASSGYPREALNVLQRVLRVDGENPELLIEVSRLHEELGRDDVALDMFLRALEPLMALLPAEQTMEESLEASNSGRPLYGARTVSVQDLLLPRLTEGILATVSDRDTAIRVLHSMKGAVDAEIDRIAKTKGVESRRMGRLPRLRHRADLFRRLAAAHHAMDLADELDVRLSFLLPNDRAFLREILKFRISWGYDNAARTILDRTPIDPSERARFDFVARDHSGAAPMALSIDRASDAVLPLLARGADDDVRSVLARLDMAGGSEEHLARLPILVGAARYLGDHERAASLIGHWLRSAFAAISDPSTLSRTLTNIVTHTQELRTLSPARYRELMGLLVELVANNPDQASTLVTRLYTFVPPGEGVLTGEQVERLVRSAVASTQRVTHGIAELFGFLPAHQRGTVLRRVWSSFPNSQKSYFLCSYVRLHDVGDDASLSAHVIEEFRRCLPQADNPSVVGSGVTRLIDDIRPANLSLVACFIDAAREQDPKITLNYLSPALRLARMTDREKAWTTAKWLFQRASEETPVNPMVLQHILTAFGTLHRDEMTELCEKVSEPTLKEHLLGFLANLRENSRPTQPSLPEARAEALAHPDRAASLTRLRRALLTEGLLFEAAEVQSRLVALSSNEQSKTQLARTWLTLNHPLRALEAAPKVPLPALPAPVVRPSRSFASNVVFSTSADDSLERLKTALAAKDTASAQRYYRQWWRKIQGDPLARRIARTISRSFAASPPPSNWESPGEAGLAEDLDEPASFARAALGDWKPKAPDADPVRVAVRSQPFARDELAREVRSLVPEQLTEPGTARLLTAMADAEREGGDLKASFEELLGRQREGNSSRMDDARLLSLLDTHGDHLPAVDIDVLDHLLPRGPSDPESIRRLARLYARNGHQDRASALYRWAATDAGATPAFPGPTHGLDHSDLVEEVAASLSGNARAQALGTLLLASRSSMRTPRAVEDFEIRVLGLLITLEGVKAAREAAHTLLPSLEDKDAPPRPTVALIVAGLLARGGEHDRALELWGHSLFPMLSSGAPLDEPAPRSVSDDDLRWLFPKDVTEWESPAVWLGLAAERIQGWVAKERLTRNDGVRLGSLIAGRFAEQGASEDAARMLKPVASWAFDSWRNQLVLSDALERCARRKEAVAIQRRLLLERRLPPRRIAFVLSHVLEEEGAEETLELGDPLTRWTLDPAMLDVLTLAATRLQDPQRVRRFESLKRNAEAARTKLLGR